MSRSSNKAKVECLMAYIKEEVKPSNKNKSMNKDETPQFRVNMRKEKRH